ncbi:MAG: phosphoribosylaminoimidazolesuccinocarboxamide synthase [Candidatus Gracilibacteria bacterium]|nr:phosphoribosylaminoimidazolesuccinocarboxamide synthase [Candidatus Gracilibacteria bacterium]
MVSPEIIQANLGNCLTETHLEQFGEKIQGKVRDSYKLPDGRRMLVVTDRQSAFDYVLDPIPFKGQVLNKITAYWFEKTKDIAPNHLISVPDPNVTIAKECKVFPVEFIVRGYITGVTGTSAWYNYEKGERMFCGNLLPEGLKKNQKFEKPIITPTTKSDEHDEKISLKEIVEQGLMSQEHVDRVSEIVLALFARGTELAAKQNLILVDTKYELGLDENGVVTVVDEVHTPDSSRYWKMETYEDRFAKGEEPESLDKEFLRLWMREQGFDYGQKPPTIPDEVRVDFSGKYIQLYETMTGEEFVPETGQPVHDRIVENLENNLKA